MIRETTQREQLREHLRDAEQTLQTGDLSDVLRIVRVDVLQGVRDNFTSSVSPEGQVWPERKHIGDGHPLLIDTGAMMQAATGGGLGHISRVEPRTMELGVDGSVIPYAAIHNYGTTKMPQREFMGAQEPILEIIDNKLADAILVEAFAGGA